MTEQSISRSLLYSVEKARVDDDLQSEAAKALVDHANQGSAAHVARARRELAEADEKMEILKAYALRRMERATPFLTLTQKIEFILCENSFMRANEMEKDANRAYSTTIVRRHAEILRDEAVKKAAELMQTAFTNKKMTAQDFLLQEIITNNSDLYTESNSFFQAIVTRLNATRAPTTTTTVAS